MSKKILGYLSGILGVVTIIGINMGVLCKGRKRCRSSRRK